ncbi:MAG: DNA polymerase III subunit alpha, partial [Pseudomonadota bacterium]
RYLKRLEHELKVIEQMGFSDYFLIVADFISWAKKEDIPVGPGRGSGAGSLVAWALYITDPDPLKFGLLFERFLNPERLSMPDFDIDFCQEKRDLVIRYVQKKYGIQQVAQIITFGTLQARAALRDVGRVLGFSWGQVDKICKLVPNNPANPLSLKQAIAQETALQQQIASEAENQTLIDIALQLEGLYRHASTHAAGVVISDRPLQELVPLYRDARSNIPVTQFNMKWVEQAGLVKFDFLGLKTLSVLAMAKDLIVKHHEHKQIDFGLLDLDDSKSYALMQKANTVGVFQLESSGMRDVLRQLKPDQFTDVVALVALYRPGPMDNIPDFIKCKHGLKQSHYLHDELKPILAETYGIAVYQEQVIQMARELAGFSLGHADLLRAAMGKKIKSEMEKQRKLFIEGALQKHQIKHQLANKIFDQMAAFAGYGFNKSHAVSYAMIAYQTAWVKANFGAEFFAASMSFELNNLDKIAVFLRDMKANHVDWLPPDINRSEAIFSLETQTLESGAQNMAVRYGLAAIRNVGRAAIEQCVNVRKASGDFKDIFDFVERMPSDMINRRSFENLVQCGAFDQLNPNRAQLFASAQILLQYGNDYQNDHMIGQKSLFGGASAYENRPALANIPPWSQEDQLNNEFKACGLYISSHPLAIYQEELAKLKICNVSDLTGKETLVNLAGVVISKRIIRARRGLVAFVQMSDMSGSFEVIIFEKLLEQKRFLLEPTQILIMQVEVSVNAAAESLRLSVRTLSTLEENALEDKKGVQIIVSSPEPIAAIGRLFTQHHTSEGSQYLEFILKQTDIGDIYAKTPPKYDINPKLRQAIKALQGVEGIYEL